MLRMTFIPRFPYMRRNKFRNVHKNDHDYANIIKFVNYNVWKEWKTKIVAILIASTIRIDIIISNRITDAR